MREFARAIRPYTRWYDWVILSLAIYGAIFKVVGALL